MNAVREARLRHLALHSRSLRGLHLVPWGIYLLFGNTVQAFHWPAGFAALAMLGACVAGYKIDSYYDRRFGTTEKPRGQWWKVSAVVVLAAVCVGLNLWLGWEFPIWLSLAAFGAGMFVRHFPYRWHYGVAAAVCIACMLPAFAASRYFVGAALMIFVGLGDHLLLMRFVTRQEA